MRLCEVDGRRTCPGLAGAGPAGQGPDVVSPRAHRQRHSRTLSAGPRLFLGVALVTAALFAASVSGAAGEPAWTTYHRDAGRSGVDPDGVNPVTPSLAWQSANLGAPIWGQPLILGTRLYVATVGDDIYALDAATGKVIWSK